MSKINPEILKKSLQKETAQTDSIGLSEQDLIKWLENIAPGLSKKTELMEALENWVINDPVVNKKVQKWGTILSQNENKADVVFSDNSFPLIVKVLAYLHTKKAFKLIGLSGKIQPGLGGDLLKFCDQNKKPANPIKAESSLFISRIKEVVKLQYYENIFGPEKRKEVLKILKHES